eukprot:SAG11_NODE_18543_length_488_cov_0.663239_1_plen_130_part_10
MQTAPTIELSEFVRDIPVTTTDREMHRYNHTVGAVRGLDIQRGYMHYMVLNFSPDFTEHVSRRFVLEISNGKLQAVQQHHDGCTALNVTQQVLNRTTSTHDRIEQQLYSSSAKVAATMRSVDLVSTMATP